VFRLQGLTALNKHNPPLPAGCTAAPFSMAGRAGERCPDVLLSSGRVRQNVLIWSVNPVRFATMEQRYV